MPKRAKGSDSSNQRNGKETSSARSAGARGSISDYEALLALQASDKLYYRIGEVSKLTGVKAHVLRYWETEFRWMTPPKSRSKQRLYRRRDIEFVFLLKRLLWEERYTIAGARRKLRDMGIGKALEELQESPPIDPRVELQRIREELLAIRASI